MNRRAAEYGFGRRTRATSQRCRPSRTVRGQASRHSRKCPSQKAAVHSRSGPFRSGQATKRACRRSRNRRRRAAAAPFNNSTSALFCRTRSGRRQTTSRPVNRGCCWASRFACRSVSKTPRYRHPAATSCSPAAPSRRPNSMIRASAGQAAVEEACFIKSALVRRPGGPASRRLAIGAANAARGRSRSSRRPLRRPGDRPRGRAARGRETTPTAWPA